MEYASCHQIIINSIEQTQNYSDSVSVLQCSGEKNSTQKMALISFGDFSKAFYKLRQLNFVQLACVGEPRLDENKCFIEFHHFTFFGFFVLW